MRRLLKARHLWRVRLERQQQLCIIHESQAFQLCKKNRWGHVCDIRFPPWRDSPEQNCSFPQIKSRNSCTKVSNLGHVTTRHSQPREQTFPSHGGSRKGAKEICSVLGAVGGNCWDVSTLESSLRQCCTCNPTGREVLVWG